MDSSGGSGDFGLGVGSIVWVRRRNGSWWPGKILGPDELSAAHLTSPRAGTPVKLLGREDASVDWYNLEKSKRVKAFRCGEFDDCIERAESSQGMPMKKREKYARREDAILHALELEKELLKKQGIEMDSNFLGSNSAKKGSFTSSEVLENGNDQLGNLETPGFSKRLGIPSKDEFMGGSSHFQEANDRGELRQEEVLPEGVPRMRGLQDFGLKISPSKRRHSSSWKHKIIHNANGLPGGDLNIGNTRHSNDPEEAGMFFRAKRSKCVYLPPGSSNSLDDGGTPQVTAEISPAVVQGGHREPNLMVEHSSRFSESTGTGSTESDLSGSESDSSETEEDEETTSLSEQGAFGAHESRTEQDSMSSGEPDDLAFSGDTSHIYSREPVSGNEAVSKWQLKGKRNIRNLGKRHPDPTDGVSSDGRRISSRRRAPIWRSGEYRNYDFSFDDDEDGDYDDEKDLESDVFGLDHEYSLTPRGAVRDRSFRGCGIAGSEDVTWEGEHCNTGSAGQRHFGVRRGMLVEVDLKVQASYQKKVVPIISMTSKLNGHSIIGHSIQIEAIEDGSSERLLTINYDGHDGVTDYSGSSAVPSAWRTARRTANFRVPRPHRSSALDGDEEGGESRLLGREGRSQKSVGAGNFNRKGLLVRKTLPQIPTPQPDRKFAGKSSKRAGLSSSQKIRTLSSLALEQNLGNKSMHDTFDSSPIDGIIKPNSSGPTTVACIPVKLVYSRLLEKINRPPSKAVINAVRLNCEMDKSRL